MKQLPFESKHRPAWRSFKADLKKVSENKISSSFPKNYRKVCQHLAIAKERGYSQPLIDELEHLVMQGHHLFYSRRSNQKGMVLKYFASDFPRAVRKHKWLVLLATLLFLLPGYLTYQVLEESPHWAYYILSDAQLDRYGEMYDPEGRIGAPAEVESEVAMWGFYIQNNVSIDFRAYASGLLFGIGSMFFMVYNGLHLGAVVSKIHELGYYETFYSFVVGHSSLELIAMVLSGAGGMAMGFSIISPGRRRFLEALQHGAKEGIQLLAGAAVMTFLAAFIEAYWSSRSDIPFQIKFGFGVGLWLLCILYFVLAGRRNIGH